MIIGRFGDTTGSPYVEAYLTLPRLGLRGVVSFLIDTGADSGVLMPPDSKKLAVDFRSLRNKTTSRGIGGISRGWNERAFLSFTSGKYVYVYDVILEIAVPTRNNETFPSLLGRDIINQWRFVTDWYAGTVTATPHTWFLRDRV